MNLASQICLPGMRPDRTAGWTVSGGKVDPPSPTSRQGGVVVKPLGTVESAPLLDRSEDQLLQKDETNVAAQEGPARFNCSRESEGVSCAAT
jgi:hypothetical protein